MLDLTHLRTHRTGAQPPPWELSTPRAVIPRAAHGSGGWDGTRPALPGWETAPPDGPPVSSAPAVPLPEQCRCRPWRHEDAHRATYPHPALQGGTQRDTAAPLLTPAARAERTGVCVTLRAAFNGSSGEGRQGQPAAALTFEAIADIFVRHVGERAVARVKEQRLSRSRQLS